MLRIESEQEEDGRWIAEVPALPGVLLYGTSKVDASAKAQALALRVIADRLEHGEPLPDQVASAFNRHYLSGLTAPRTAPRARCR